MGDAYIDPRFDEYREEIQYCIDTFYEHLALKDRGSIFLSYTDKKRRTGKPTLRIIPSGSIFRNDMYLKPESLPGEMKGYEGLPVLYSNGTPFIEIEDNEIVTNIDVITTYFFYLTRYEEYVFKNRDIFGRFPDKDSCITRLNLQRIPVLDIYIDLIRKLLNKNFGVSFEDESGYFLLTHDVDRLNSIISFKTVIKFLFRKRSFEGLKWYIKDVFNENGILNTIDRLLDLDKRYTWNSIYFFLPRKGTFLRPDADYSIKQERIRKYIWKILRYGNRIVLHPSFETQNDIDRLKMEKMILEECTGRPMYFARKHYLRYTMNETFDAFHGVGIRYDSSIGFIDDVGYKVGTARPFEVFNISKGRAGVVELPLIVMDGALKKCSKEDTEVAKDYVITLINNTVKFGGVFTLLWHNSSLHGPLWKELGVLYEWILDRLSKTNLKNYIEELDL